MHAGGQWEKACNLFELMQQQGCTPDVVTYTALISAFERGGKWQLALQVGLLPAVPPGAAHVLAIKAGLAAVHTLTLYLVSRMMA